MRILIVSTFFPPLNSIASLRPYSWAKYWTLEGHKITVLTMEKQVDPKTALNLPNPGFKVIEAELPNFFKKLKKGHTESSMPKNQSWLLSCLDYLRFKKGILNACRMPDITHFWISKALKAVSEEKVWDLVVSSAGPYTVHLVAEKIKKSGRAKKWVADYRDTWSDNYVYPGLFPFNQYERYLEHKILKSADLITTISEPFAKEFARKYRNVMTIENGFDFDDTLKLPEENVLPSDGKYRIIHTGSLYQGKRDPSELFKAIQIMSQNEKGKSLLDNLEVLFIGTRQANVEALIERYQVGRWVKQAGFVSREKALKLQVEAHALLFLPWNDPSIDGVLTGKIFEYLAAGRPILAIGCPEMEASQKLILESKAGVILPRAENIQKFLLDQLKFVSKTAVQVDPTLLQRYDRKFLANKMLQQMIQL